MTKTFEELVDTLVWETSLVGDKIYFQDENTPDEECYWLSYKDAIDLLKLVREKTLKECEQFIIDSSHNNYAEEFASLSKDSIEL